MRHLTLVLALAVSAAPVSAGLLGKSALDVAKLLREYRGSSIEALVEPLGYPDHQEPILDKTVYLWGEDHEDGPVCIVRAVAGADKVVVDTHAYGNILGCDQIAKRLKAHLPVTVGK